MADIPPETEEERRERERFERELKERERRDGRGRDSRPPSGENLSARDLLLKFPHVPRSNCAASTTASAGFAWLLGVQGGAPAGIEKVGDLNPSSTARFVHHLYQQMGGAGEASRRRRQPPKREGQRRSEDRARQ